MIEAEWRTVRGWEGYYEVSDRGDVLRDGRILKATLNRNGYFYVSLKRPRRRENVTVHRIVARAFHGDPLKGQEVRHLDGVPANNRADNLRWGTHAQNVADSIVHGTYVNPMSVKTHCVRGHEFTEVNTLRSRGEGRRCRTCANEWARRARRSKREGGSV